MAAINTPIMNVIQLFGISETKDINDWFSLVDEALHELEVELDIQIVNDVQLFVYYNLSGIPALVINEEVVFQKEVPTLEALTLALKERLDEFDVVY
ncbi:MAG: hypothetical protein DA408_15935 [Bacteroidetes bacterium]|nr:MAG: hypothetical protein C7N36_21035 [Bacteroidota bacterium]PTM10472.1 MAG: hypothetical protein DA408_15935 [Bacteroidota bacterium]